MRETVITGISRGKMVTFEQMPLERIKALESKVAQLESDLEETRETVVRLATAGRETADNLAVLTTYIYRRDVTSSSTNE